MNYRSYLFKIALVYVQNNEEVEEIINNVFLNLWNKRQKLTFDERTVAYAYKTTKNECFNFIRKQKNKPHTIELNKDINLPQQKNSDLESKELQKAIDKAIEELPERCKEIFLLSRKSGLKNLQIAQLLEISEKTVENQMSIALKKIRIFLKKMKLL